MANKIEKIVADTEVDVTAIAEESLQEVTAPLRVLRTHAGSYVAQKKKGHEAVVSVCLAKTGKRVTLSVKQLEKELGFDSTKDWLEICYDDADNAVLIGKSDGEQGVKPIVTNKKFIIYSSLIVKDFVETLQLDFAGRSSVSAYDFQTEKIDSKKFIVLTNKDFV